MSSDHPPRGRGDAATDPVRAAHETWHAAEFEEDGEGGDPACWAGLVCQECGAVISEGHRCGCSYLESSGPGGRSSTLAESG
jgi:hypothetical protein